MACARSSPLARGLLLVVASGPACRGSDHGGPAEQAAEQEPASREPPSRAPAPDPSDSACDVPALRETAEQLSRRWTSWSPRAGTLADGSFEAIAAVWNHCPTLPDSAKEALDAVVDHSVWPSKAALAMAEGRPAPAPEDDDDPLDALLPGHARFDQTALTEEPAAWAWLRPICPDSKAVAEAIAEAPATERKEISWDRCRRRFDFVTRDQFLRSSSEAERVGFALHHWLTTEARVDEAIADLLARALVLGPHWMAEGLGRDLRLPAAEVQTPLGEGLVVELRPDAVFFGRRRIAPIDPTHGVETEIDVMPIVPELRDTLALEVERSTELAERHGHAEPVRVLLFAHRDLTWKTVEPVLRSMNRAGVGQVALVVLADDRVDPLRAVTIQDTSIPLTKLLVPAPSTVQELVDEVATRPGPIRLLP